MSAIPEQNIQTGYVNCIKQFIEKIRSKECVVYEQYIVASLINKLRRARMDIKIFSELKFQKWIQKIWNTVNESYEPLQFTHFL